MNDVSAETGHLWQRFHDELHRFVRARAVSEAAAQDVLQQTFLRAHTRLLHGDVPEQPRAWLYQIARNLVVDTHRHTGRDRALGDALAREPDTEDDRPIDEEAFVLVARALPLFIEGLEPKYRDALRMTELEGLTQAEAAERAGVSLSGMKSRVQRGRKQVFEALTRCCAFELDARGRMMECAPRAGDCC